MLPQIDRRALTRAFHEGTVLRGRAGWARTSLHLSLRNAFLKGVIGFDVLVGFSALVEGGGHLWQVPMLLGAVFGLVVAWAGIAERLPSWTSVWTTFVLSTFAVYVAPSDTDLLAFVSVWAVHLATALPAVVMRGWVAVVSMATGCFAYSIVLVLVHPDWGWGITAGQVAAGFGIFVVLRAGLTVLAEVARRADAASDIDERRFLRLEERRRFGRQLAEDSRTLHDTAINTLAAIANGGAGIRDRALVRERCAQDVAELRDLRMGEVNGSDLGRSGFSRIRHAGAEIEHTGLEGLELAEALEDLPSAVRAALERASYEVVLNAVKHSGVSVVHVDVRRGDAGLDVSIRDHGSGFEPAATPLRGMAESVFERANEVGIEVSLDSAPGRGTSVDLRAPWAAGVPADPAAPAVKTEDLGLVVSRIREGAVWLWAAGVLMVGVFLELVMVPGRLTLTYAALAVGVLSLILAWVTRASREPATRAVVTVTLVAAAATSYVLACWTWDFGRTDPALWQVLIPTGPLVLLRQLGGRGATRSAIATLMATSVVVAVLGWSESPTASLIAVTGAAMACGFLAGWIRFDDTIGEIARRLADSQSRLLHERLSEELRIRSQDVRESWRAAGLDRVAALLEGIAQGDLDPADDQVRQDCGDEEFHLRKLIQLDPELIRLMPWFLQAVGAARERGVDLVIRSGGVEPSEQAVVDDLGTVLLDAVYGAERGDRVTVTLYRLGSGALSLVVVVPHPLLIDRGVPDLGGVTPSVTTVGNSDVLEALLATH